MYCCAVPGRDDAKHPARFECGGLKVRAVPAARLADR